MATGYVIDASVWIDMGKHYFPEIFPSLWKSLEDLAAARALVVPREVHREVKDPIEIHDWMNKVPGLVASPTSEVEIAAKAIIGVHPTLIDPNSTDPNADPYVIALAKHCGFSVVSQETAKGKPTAPKHNIPFVCSKLSVAHLSMREFFKEAKFSF